MSKYQFFFVGSDGIVKQNESIMPLDVVREACPKGPVMRFAFDPNENTIFIQDESFRKLLGEGDDCAWHLINHALYALEEQTEARFPRREFGDPPNSAILRKLSNYPRAWEKIKRPLADSGVEPVDIPVYEYIAPPDRANETVVFIPVGAMIGDRPADVPCLGVNRMIHKAIPEMASGDDVDYLLISMALQCYYLDNIKDLMRVIGTEEANKVLEALSRTKISCRMFALDLENQTRVFKATQDSEGKFPTEEDIRKKLPTYKGPVVIFDWENGSIILKNALPSRMFGDEIGKRISADIKKALSRVSGLPADEVFFGMDPSLESPYAYDSNIISPMLSCLCEGETRISVDFIEVPGLHTESITVHSAKEEDHLIPDFQAYRAARGISISYPFVAIRAEMSNGKKMGEMARKYREIRGDKENRKGMPFVHWIYNEKERCLLKKKMRRMLHMGFQKKDILDVFSSETDLLRRAEYGLVLDEAFEESCPKKVALAGRAIGINDWWHIIVPEALNLKSEDKKPSVKVLNPEAGPKVPPEKASIEILLERDRDERQAHKPMETLLRESMI